jgi:hypothetical protein
MSTTKSAAGEGAHRPPQLTEAVQTNQSAESDSGHTEKESPRQVSKLDRSETKLAAVADRYRAR